MGDVAQGIKAFKKGMSEDETKAEPPKNEPVKSIDHQPTTSGAATGELQNRANTEKKFEGGTV
jgi:sec-independent protein translocase protein TatA